jgi:hypothetical protein
MLWAIARACVQSITIDEADTYLAFVRPPEVFQWFPASNNHVLNSLLMRLFTSLFGASNLTVRMPALIGAALYISASYLLVRLIARGPLLRWILFVCLVYNPFVFDHLVAARGYGLAAGFLLWAIAIPASYQFRIESGRTVSLCKACLFSSVAIGFSFASNFSFGFVDASALTVVFLWCCAKTHGQRYREWAMLAAACILPFLFISLFLSASVLFQFPKSELYFGANSFRQMFRSILDHSFFEPNPEIVNPLLLPVVRNSEKFLLRLIALFGIARLISTALPKGRRGRWCLGIGASFAGATSLALLLHWTAFRWFQLPLPRDRTALFFAPLAVLLLGAIAAMPARRRLYARLVRGGFTTALLLLSFYFITCLRLTYFKDWYWDRDVEAAYSVLAYYNHKFGVRDIAASWHYASSLNFYRVVSGHETINEFANLPPEPDYPTDREVYVLFYPFGEKFIDREKLKIVFRGRNSELTIAIRPELEMRTPSCGGN